MNKFADAIFLLFRPKRFLPSSYKRYWFTCRDLHLFLYKTKGDSNPALHINLRGCEALPDVNISAGKFGIKLSVPNKEDGMTEMWIRCDNVSILKLINISGIVP